MRTRLTSVVILPSVLTLPDIARSQAVPPPGPPMDVHALKNFQPIGAPLPVSTTGFLRYQWVCSVQDNYENYDKVGRPGNPGETTLK